MRRVPTGGADGVRLHQRRPRRASPYDQTKLVLENLPGVASNMDVQVDAVRRDAGHHDVAARAERTRSGGVHERVVARARGASSGVSFRVRG